MTEDTPTQTGELGAMPDAEIEPGETNPGGVDALPVEDEIVPADPNPDTNPAVEETPDPLQDALEEGEDTETEATKSEDGEVDEDTEDKEPPV